MRYFSSTLSLLTICSCAIFLELWRVRGDYFLLFNLFAWAKLDKILRWAHPPFSDNIQQISLSWPPWIYHKVTSSFTAQSLSWKLSTWKLPIYVVKPSPKRGLVYFNLPPISPINKHLANYASLSTDSINYRNWRCSIFSYFILLIWLGCYYFSPSNHLLGHHFNWKWDNADTRFEDLALCLRTTAGLHENYFRNAAAIPNRCSSYFCLLIPGANDTGLGCQTPTVSSHKRPQLYHLPTKMTSMITVIPGPSVKWTCSGGVCPVSGMCEIARCIGNWVGIIPRREIFLSSFNQFVHLSFREIPRVLLRKIVHAFLFSNSRKHLSVFKLRFPILSSIRRSCRKGTL